MIGLYRSGIFSEDQVSTVALRTRSPIRRLLGLYRLLCSPYRPRSAGTLGISNSEIVQRAVEPTDRLYLTVYNYGTYIKVHFMSVRA